MSRTVRETRTLVSGVALLALLAAMCTPCRAAEVRGSIRNTSGQTIEGMIRYQPASKVYVIRRGDNIEMRVLASQVDQIRVAEPAELKPALRQVAAGQYSAAEKALVAIRDQYTMLQWDVVATRALAEAYLGMKQPAKAVEMCDSIVRQSPEEAFGQLAQVYWEALLQAGREATLRDLLGKAAERGSRELAAMALVKRGDIDRKNGKFRDALVDGYLRVVVLYEQIKTVQPEALYKAVRCFEELGQSSHAEKMRKKLLGEYSRDRYAEMMRAGA